MSAVTSVACIIEKMSRFEDQTQFVKTSVLGSVNLEAQFPIKSLEKYKAKSAFEKLQDDRKNCPIYICKDELLQAISDHQVLVIVGDTGSGKTSQVPQYLHEAGYTKHGMLGCTQTRRVAVMNVAGRVSKEMDTKLGNEVGYSVCFEDCTSKTTLIKYMTDETLLRELLAEPLLESYSVVMLDEAQDRTLPTDILCCLLKDIAQYRPDLKLLILSAPLNAEKLTNYFGFAPVYEIPGRRFPVEIYHTKAPEANYLDAATVPDLSSIILLLKTLGNDDLDNFNCMDPPRKEQLLKARNTLFKLKALNNSGELMRLGQIMTEFPIEPMLVKMVVASEDYSCSEEIIVIVAMLCVEHPTFCYPKRRNIQADTALMQFHGNGDFIALLKVYSSWKESNYSIHWCYENYIKFRSMKRARKIRDQLEGLLMKVRIELKSNSDELEAIMKITAGFSLHSATLQTDGCCKTECNKMVRIHPSSGLAQVRPSWVVYRELVKTTKAYMHQVGETKEEWLRSEAKKEG